MLALRANDRFENVVLYQCSSSPPPAGEFEPNGGCSTQPVDVKVAQILPFTFSDLNQFRPDGPDPLTSNAYTEDFIETRDYGRIDSQFRSPEQTDIVYLWSEHTYGHWNRNLINLAISRGLSDRDTARLFAMVQSAAADAIIAGFEAKSARLRGRGGPGLRFRGRTRTQTQTPTRIRAGYRCSGTSSGVSVRARILVDGRHGCRCPGLGY